MSVAWVAVGAAAVGTAVSYKSNQDAIKAAKQANTQALSAAEKEFDTQMQLAQEGYNTLMGGTKMSHSVMQIGAQQAPVPKLTKTEGLIDQRIKEASDTTIGGALKAKDFLTEAFGSADTLLANGQAEVANLLSTAASEIGSSYAQASSMLSSGLNQASSYLDAGVGALGQGYAKADQYLASVQAKVESTKQQFAGTMGEDAIATLSQSMQKWDSTFGPVLDNLSSFYRELTAQDLVGQQLTIQAQEFQQVKDSLAKSFAQRGIVAGAQASLTMQAELDNARSRSGIRQDAPFQLAAAQQGFLGQQSAMLNPYEGALAQTQYNSSVAEADFASQMTGAYGTVAGQRAGLATQLAGQQAGLYQSKASAALQTANQQAGLRTAEADRLATIRAEQAASANRYASTQASLATQLGQQQVNLASNTYDKLSSLALAKLDAETEAVKLKSLQGSSAASNLSGATQASIAAQGQTAVAASQAQAQAFGDLTAAGLTAFGKYYDSNKKDNT